MKNRFVNEGSRLFKVLFCLGVFALCYGAFSPAAHAQSCPTADAADGTTDGIITINSGGTTTWTDTDGTAFDCATLDIYVTNSSTLKLDQNPSSGYYGAINVIDITVDNGSSIQVNGEGCINSQSPNVSTGVCASGGTSEGADAANSGGGGGAAQGNGGRGAGASGGTFYSTEIFAPRLPGAGGGNSTDTTGGYGGGALYLNLSGNLVNNGTLSANGYLGNGNTGNGHCGAGCGNSGGGGAAGSLYVDVAGNLSGSGLYQAKGGAGTDANSDSGGGGGGWVYVEYATTSIGSLSTNLPSYTDVSGGTTTANAAAGESGGAIFKDATAGLTYIAEGVSRMSYELSFCSSNVCTVSSDITVWNGSELRLLTDTTTGEYVTLNVTGDVSLESGGSIASNGLGCPSTASPNGTTRICASGGTTEGGDANGGSGGGAASGSGGNGTTTGGTGGVYMGTNVFSPKMFGSAGGSYTAASSPGGYGGGIVQMAITGNLSNEGSITANGYAGNGNTGNGHCGANCGGAGGGGAGGSVNVTVSGNLSGAGTYEANGGNGADGSSDAGGGGGGWTYVAYGTTSIDSIATNFLTYAETAGGTGPGSAADGSAGSSVFKNSTTGMFYIAEGASRLSVDSCVDNTCSLTGDITVWSGAELKTLGDKTAGDYVTLAITGDVTVDSGGDISVDGEGCTYSESSNSSGVCASGGTGEGVDGTDQGAGGGASQGSGGAGGNTAGGTYYTDSIFVLGLPGSGGGNSTNTRGGLGGGVLRLVVTGDVVNNGNISANGYAANNNTGLGHCGDGCGNSGGGGGAGSVYMTVSGNLSGTGTYGASGGNGSSGTGTRDGGGGGGGWIFVSYATTSFADVLTNIPTYVSVAGGDGPGNGTDGGVGGAIFKNTTTDMIYFVEGTTKYPLDDDTCSDNVCTISSDVEVWNGAGIHTETDTSTGDYVLLTFEGDVNVRTGGEIESDSEGCSSSAGPNTTTNVCASGTSSEGNDGTDTGGGAAHGGAGGNGSSGTLGATATYGTATEPVLFGAGGGASSTATGGTGGGVLVLNISGTLTQNGTLSTDGGAGGTTSSKGAGGGAGGSLWVVADTLEGSSTSVFSRGGAGGDTTADGGGGGGGRICISYNTNNGTWLTGLSAATNTAGGSGPGTATDGSSGSLDTSTCESFNETPVVSAVTASQGADGAVDITVEVDDADDQDGLTLQVLYSQDGGGTFPGDPTLQNPTGDFGTPVVDNDDTYQISSVNTALGSNTISFEWNGSALAIADTDFRIRVIANDGISDSDPADSANFSADFIPPTSSSVTAVQRTDGSKIVDVTVEADAPDDDTLSLRVLGSDNGGSTFVLDPTLQNVSADFDTPAIDNAQTYQISNVVTSSGSNTVSFEWAGSGTAIAGDDTQIRVLAYDGNNTGTASDSASFTVDFVSPSAGTVTYETSTDADESTFTGNGWEAGTTLYVNDESTGEVIGAGSPSFSYAADLTDGVGDNVFVVKAVDSYGNESSEVEFTITRTAAGGGSDSNSNNNSNTNTTPPVEEEEGGETVVEETPDEAPEEGDYAIAGEPATDDEVSAEDVDEGESISGEEEEETAAPDEEESGQDAQEVEGEESEEDAESEAEAEEAARLAEISAAAAAQALEEEEASERAQSLRLVGESVESESRVFGEVDDESGLPESMVDHLFGGDAPSASQDSDGDGVSDIQEVLLGTNPYYEETGEDYGIASSPPDLTEEEEEALEEEIATYMEENDLDAEELSVVDSDSDGLSDAYEFLYGTDPSSADSDGDGYSDGFEMFFMGSSPSTQTSSTYIWGIHISNYEEDDEAQEGEQTVIGFASPDAYIEIYDVDANGNMTLVGRGAADENGSYAINTRYITAGDHFLLAVEIAGNKAGAISNLIRLNVREDLALLKPEYDSSVLQYGDKKEVAEVRLGLKNEGEQLRQTLDLSRQIVHMIVWESTVLGQTAIADSSSKEGTIIFLPPTELELGKHDVSWFTMDLKNDVRSDSGNLKFSVVPTAFYLTNTTARLNLIPAIVAVTLLIGLLVYLRRKAKN